MTVSKLGLEEGDETAAGRRENAKDSRLEDGQGFDIPRSTTNLSVLTTSSRA